MGVLYRHHLVVRANLFFFLVKFLTGCVQHVGLSGFLTPSFVVSRHEEEGRVLSVVRSFELFFSALAVPWATFQRMRSDSCDLCGECYLVGRAGTGSACRQGHVALVVKPSKTPPPVRWLWGEMVGGRCCVLDSFVCTACASFSWFL